MRFERNDELSADQIDAFWDDLVLGYAGGTAAEEREELAMMRQLQTVAGMNVSPESIDRVRAHIIASPENQRTPVRAAVPRPSPVKTPPTPRFWTGFGRVLSFGVTAALVLVVVGGIWLAGRDRGLPGSNDEPSVVVPGQAVGSPISSPSLEDVPLAETGSSRGIAWRLAPIGGNAHNALVAVGGETIYRASSTDGFTGVEAIDAATGVALWQTPLDWTGSSIAADDTGVYVLFGESIVAIEGSNVANTWTIDVGGQAQHVIVDQQTLFAWDGVVMRAFDAGTGESLWTAQPVDAGDAAVASDGIVNAPVVIGDIVVAVDAAGVLAGFDRQSGTPLWSISGYTPGETRVAAGDGETVLAFGPRAGEDGSPPAEHQYLLSAIDAAAGTPRWETGVISATPEFQPTGRGVAVLAELVVPMSVEGQVTEEYAPETALDDYPVRGESSVYILDPSTGNIVRNEEGLALISNAGVPAFTGLMAGVDGSSVVATSDSGRITVVSTDDSSVTSIVDAGSGIDAILESPAGQSALLGSGTLVGLDTAVLSGEGGLIAEQRAAPDALVDWILPHSLEGEFVRQADTALADGVLYRAIETSGGRWIEAVYAVTGQVAWQVAADWTEQGIVASPAGAFFVDSTNQMVALDAATGQQQWVIPFGEPVTSLVVDGRLYVMDASNGMTTLDPATGELDWTVQIGNEPTATPGAPGPAPVFAGADYLLVLDADGVLHAISRESGGVAWSVGFDPVNTRVAWQDGVVLVLWSPGDDQLLATGLDMESGNAKWAVELSGPLFQPVATNETFFYLIADKVMVPSELDTTYDPMEDNDEGSTADWVGSVEVSNQDAGGDHVFALDAQTGDVIWARSTRAGGFVELGTILPNSGGLWTMTTDGQQVWLGRDAGTIQGVNDLRSEFGAVPLEIVDSGSTELGRFATLPDGSLVNFGTQAFNRMG
ncbi:MAG: PQQ-binding-like beta-propeller repeat protein [Thermomicrobiales bacterium]|nr:PQQ-binding-like beta-propeller repeat protein [Thermomicrobiales bacterium]